MNSGTDHLILKRFRAAPSWYCTCIINCMTTEKNLIRALFALVAQMRVAAVVDLLVLLTQIGEVQTCSYYTHLSSWAGHASGRLSTSWIQIPRVPQSQYCLSVSPQAQLSRWQWWQWHSPPLLAQCTLSIICKMRSKWWIIQHWKITCPTLTYSLMLIWISGAYTLTDQWIRNGSP